tara:strand:+ start:2614 stop:3324 length:711 start_codon:yes stop_codon:yes gene_type:complete
MPIFIAIPTYDRVDVFRKKTYTKIIQKYKLEKYVTLFIQSDKDASDYKELAPELKQVRSPKGYLNTLNFISKYYPDKAKVVKMDDDLTGIYKLTGDKLTKVSNAYDLFNKTFAIMVNTGSSLGGFYPIPNAGFMKDRKAITTDLRFIVGSLYCFINRNIKLKIDGKSDFEFTIENYKRDDKVIRLNNYTMRYDYSDNTEKSGRDTQIFEKKYNEYISKVITHKDGSTSFLLKKNPD